MAKKIGAVVLILVSWSFWACAKKDEAKVQKAQGTRIAIVYAIGGRGDPFNDSAYAEIQRARKETNVQITEVEPTQLAEYEPSLKKLSEAGHDLIFAVGYLFEDAVKRVASDFTKTKYAIIDGTVDKFSNVACLHFTVNEGSFLVGAIAALKSSTNRIGFIGGTDIPIINQFRYGYEAGARYVNPKVQVRVAYLGIGPAAFKDPVKGKEFAVNMYRSKVDIIYHAAGASGNGIIEAAKELRKYAIGVDVNQNYLAPGNVLTSMLKRLDIAIYQIITNYLKGSFNAGIIVYRLKEGGVGYVIDKDNEQLLSKTIRDKITDLESQIIDGKIRVPSEKP